MKKDMIIKVEGMKCQECANTIEQKLNALPGVLSAKASFGNKEVEVDFNSDQVSLNDITQEIIDAGFEIVME